jgi:hypothetical protein
MAADDAENAFSNEGEQQTRSQTTARMCLFYLTTGAVTVRPAADDGEENKEAAAAALGGKKAG